MRTIILAALIAGSAAPAFADATPYQPASMSASRYGFSEAYIAPERVRISFSGNAETTLDDAEAFVLYRAAEVSLLRGYSHFQVVDHHVETRTELAPSGPPLPPIAPRRYREFNRYAVSSDIVMHRGAPPSSARNAYDALEVRENLVWRVAQPF
ncbi:MAG: hypothetical protein GC189_12260 [Alphaproteobacteria bacterium]|nr:hypothetical protein [Alphaproteobacteria bacterium]